MSHEFQNVEVRDPLSFVDEVLGGAQTLHSQEEKTQNHEAENVLAKDDGDSPIPDEEGFPFSSDDSIGDEQSDKREKDIPEEGALKKEIEVLKKRLHDTQSAMHKATGEHSKLQKELTELKTRQKDEDDWFSESDKQRVEKLEEDLKKSDVEVNQFNSQEQEITKQAAEKEWDVAAAPVIAKNPDFEKVVYDELVTLLDESSGNALVRAEWKNLKDKSPSAVYEFAKKSMEIIDFQRDPEAYKEKLRMQFGQSNNMLNIDDAAPLGKEGLDMLLSADVPIEKSSGRLSFIDEVFGK